jgi:hydrogenase maturation factor HypF (carbamoyltransferase family)
VVTDARRGTRVVLSGGVFQDRLLLGQTAAPLAAAAVRLAVEEGRRDV